MMDQLVTFAAGLPGWMGLDGLPLSWKHFCHGMAYLRRKAARDILDLGAGVRGGMATESSYAKWRSEMEMKA